MSDFNNKIKFKYVGRNIKGRKIKGFVFSESTVAAKNQLEKEGVFDIKVKKYSSISPFGKKITQSDIALFSRQMATMLRSGIPLIQCFEMVAENIDKTAMKKLVYDLKADIENGVTFQDAVKQHPQYFNSLYCSLLEAGVLSGQLDEMLDRIATYQEKSELLKLKVKKAIKYPISVLVVAAIVTAVLLIKVIPVFKDLFASFGSELPAYTQMVVDLSENLQSNWFIYLAILFGIIYITRNKFRKSESFQHSMQRLSLNLPVIGDIAYKSIIARYCRTLSTTFSSGLAMPACLEAASKAANNIVYTEAIDDVLEEVLNGQRVNIAMRQTSAFPNMVIQMVAIGEESGAMDRMLDKAATYYENEVDNAVDGLTSMLESLIMAFLAVIVGGLVIAMYLPIFTMGSAM